MRLGDRNKNRYTEEMLLRQHSGHHDQLFGSLDEWDLIQQNSETARNHLNPTLGFTAAPHALHIADGTAGQSETVWPMCSQNSVPITESPATAPVCHGAHDLPAAVSQSSLEAVSPIAMNYEGGQEEANITQYSPAERVSTLDRHLRMPGRRASTSTQHSRVRPGISRRHTVYSASSTRLPDAELSDATTQRSRRQISHPLTPAQTPSSLTRSHWPNRQRRCSNHTEITFNAKMSSMIDEMIQLCNFGIDLNLLPEETRAIGQLLDVRVEFSDHREGA